MEVARFNQSTGWAGKAITCDGNELMLEDYGPIRAIDVLGYDQRGQLNWPSAELREWIVQLVSTEAAPQVVATESAAFDKGRHLEQEIARVLEAGGYAVSRNLVREGRSGARHEIDVFGEKSDGLTAYSLVVECKAWAKPINKDVIAKARHVAGDIGAHKVIVVGLEGATLGAEQTAAQLGVELWGPEELERRLGQVAVAGIAHQAKRLAMGFQPVLDKDTANRVAEKERQKGLFGLGQEQVEFFDLVWIPCLVVQLGCARVDGRLRKRIKHTAQFNVYEMLSGRFLWSSEESPSLVEVDIAPYSLPAQLHSRAFRGDLVQTFRKWKTAVQDAARQRHTTAAQAKGIPLPLSELTADEFATCHLPAYVAVVQSKGKRRAVVVNARTGRLSKRLSEVLTPQLHFLTEALGQA
jgi:hypothetical protein